MMLVLFSLAMIAALRADDEDDLDEPLSYADFPKAKDASAPLFLCKRVRQCWIYSSKNTE